MCGRFNIIDDPLAQLLIDITGQRRDWAIDTEYNIAPTQDVPVLLFDEDDRGWTLKWMRWWLTPAWSDGPSTRYSMFNARSETLHSSRAYREPFKARRCIVPATGYYEWKKSDGQKLPYYMTPLAESGFAFAGLWERWEDADHAIESCTIVTSAAPVSMQGIHHRIPVHMTAAQSQSWVSKSTPLNDLDAIMVPSIRSDIRVTPVSTVVNNARNKDERCIEPLGDSFVISSS